MKQPKNRQHQTWSFTLTKIEAKTLTSVVEDESPMITQGMVEVSLFPPEEAELQQK